MDTLRVPLRLGSNSWRPGSQPLKSPTTLTTPGGVATGKEKVTLFFMPNKGERLIIESLRVESNAPMIHDCGTAHHSSAVNIM